MTKKNLKSQGTKKAFLASLVAMLLCIAMLIGTTLAWFTDSVTSGANKIVAGNLDIEVQYYSGTGDPSTDTTNWTSLEGSDSLFSQDLWEPGHTEVVYLRVANNGTLSLNYSVKVSPISEVSGISTVNDAEFKLSDYLVFKTTAPAMTSPYYAQRSDARDEAGTETKLNQTNLQQSGVLYSKSDTNIPVGGLTEAYTALVVYMPESVSNEANYKTGTTAPQINLGVTVYAWQEDYESDSFGYDYDVLTEDSENVYINSVSKSAQINKTDDATTTTDSNVVIESSGDVTIKTDTKIGETAVAQVVIPAAAIENGNHTVTLNVYNDEEANGNFSAEAENPGIAAGTRETTTYEVNVTKDGTKVTSTDGIYYTVDMYIGTDLENLVMYHRGEVMTQIASETTFDANNQYKYNGTTGYVTMYVKDFSPFTAAYDVPEILIVETGTRMSLATFRDKVNAGNTYAGYTAQLLKDVDLSSTENWTPIGASDHPFSGVFDGNEKTISGLKITSTAMNQGLFGCVSGTANSDYNVDSIWNNENKQLSTDCIAESKYTAVIKDLTISGASVLVSFSGTSDDSEATAALVGLAKNAYLYNVSVTKSNVIGYKQVGSIAGKADNSVINTCTTDNQTTVSMNTISKYTIGGILGTGRNNTSVVNCTNNATVTGAASTCMGGVVGQTLGSAVIANCVNNGSVTNTYSGGDQTKGSEGLTGGVAGSVQCAKYIVNCTNNGTVSNTGSILGAVAGIGNYSYGQDSTYYNCKNTGNVTAKALYAGGIVGFSSERTETLEACVNTGAITNSNESGKTGSLVGQSSNLIIKNVSFATADNLKQALPAYAGNLELSGVNVENAGELELGAITKNLKTDATLSSNVSMKITDAISESWITLDSVGMTVTIPQGTTVYALNCNGANMNVTNNGTVTGSINANGDATTITNNSTIGGVSLAGQGCTFTNESGSIVKGNISTSGNNCTVTNKGTVGENTSTHTLSYSGATNAVFNNYGTVYGCTGAGAYVIYTKDKVGVTLNLYSGSKLINRNAWVCTQGTVDPTDKGSITFNYATGTCYNNENQLNDEATEKLFNTNDYAVASYNKIQ